MRIGFDASQTGNRKAGCGYFAESLIRHLVEADPHNQYLLYPAVGDTFWDPECATGTYRGHRSNCRAMPAPKSFEESCAFWTNPPPDFEEQLGHPDVFHANNFFCPRGLRRGRIVYTLHDLSFLDNPEWTTEANRVGCFRGVFQASLSARLVLCVSEHTKKRFLDHFPQYPAQRVRVVYPGSRFAGRRPLPRPESLRHLETAKFWLSVGTIEPRKNHQRLIEAYARLVREVPTPLPLVIAGAKGWLVGDPETRLRDHGLRQSVNLMGYVNDAELQWLYANCFAVVYPSLYEGFGLPVIEAMSLGAAVISSDVTSIPEIVGAAGILVDPQSEEAIVAAMKRLLAGEVNRERLKEAALAEARRFSWASAARRVLACYEEAAAGERVAATA